MKKCFIFLVVFVCSFSTHTIAKCIYKQGIYQSDIFCDEENDTITGDFKNNLISGSNGNDILNGGSGNDIIEGGMGNDTLTGGLGNDNFFFDIYGDNTTPEAINDIIKDFGNGIDTIELNNYYQNGLVLSPQQTDTTGKYYTLSNSTKNFTVKIYSNKSFTLNSLGIKYRDYGIKTPIPQTISDQYQLVPLVQRDRIVQAETTDKTYTQYAFSRHGIPIFATNNVTISQITAHIREINSFFDRIYYQNKNDILNILQSKNFIILIRKANYGTIIAVNNNQNTAALVMAFSNASGFATIHEIAHAISVYVLANISAEYLSELSLVFKTEGPKFYNTTWSYAATNYGEYWAEIVKYGFAFRNGLGRRASTTFITPKAGQKMTLKEFSPASYNLLVKYLHANP